MSIEDNKAIVRRWVEIVMGKELESFSEVLAPDCVFHMMVGDISPEQYRQGIEAVYKSVVPFHVTIEDIFAEGDKVATRGTWGGIHRGELRGVPPTGNRFKVINTGIWKISGGKLAEAWPTLDIANWDRQLEANE